MKKHLLCLLLLGGALGAYAVESTSPDIAEVTQQEVTVKGVITDAKGEPIIGATVTEKGTHISDYTYVPSFFTDMWKNRQFVSKVMARWKEISPRVMSEFWPETKRYAQAAAEAMKLNALRWPIDKDYATEIDRMERWIQLRVTFMDNLVSKYPEGN